ncbi:MAG TPA: Type 1 glutamine amidotransferase-like domain-containing protein [Candidatus Paceibacterota bacterium]
MKTKYVLCGGWQRAKGYEGLRPFYEEILKDTTDKVRVLLVLFASDDNRIDDEFVRTKNLFEMCKGDKELEYVVADKETFREQVKSSDIVYLSGGKTLRLMEALGEYSDYPAMFDGKTVAGESAGANVLGGYYYSTKTSVVGQGLGLVPYKIIPHYVSLFAGKLDDVGPDLEELDLPEYQYKVHIV